MQLTPPRTPAALGPHTCATASCAWVPAQPGAAGQTGPHAPPAHPLQTCAPPCRQAGQGRQVTSMRGRSAPVELQQRGRTRSSCRESKTAGWLAGWLAGWPAGRPAGRPTCQSLLRWAARAAGRRCHHPEPPCACALQQSRGRGAHAAAEALRESRLDTFLAVSPGASCDSSCAAALCAALQAGKAGSGKSFSARQFASTVQRKLGGQQARQERIAATRRTRQAGRQAGRRAGRAGRSDSPATSAGRSSGFLAPRGPRVATSRPSRKVGRRCSRANASTCNAISQQAGAGEGADKEGAGQAVRGHGSAAARRRCCTIQQRWQLHPMQNAPTSRSLTAWYGMPRCSATSRQRALLMACASSPCRKACSTAICS
jgi:hypothetical protein